MTDIPSGPPPVLPTNAPILNGSPWLTEEAPEQPTEPPPAAT